jgi:hypothetical protein
VLELLTSAGFLRWTAAQTVVRTGRDLLVTRDGQRNAVLVGSVQVRDKSVAAA